MGTGELHRCLGAQRDAIVSSLEDMALAVMTNHGDEGASLVAEVIQQCIEVVRWTPYVPDAS